MTPEWYQMPVDEVLSTLGTDATTGLSTAEAQARLAKAGPNELVEKGGRTRAQILWEQVSGVLTILLVVAAGISAFLVAGIGWDDSTL